MPKCFIAKRENEVELLQAWQKQSTAWHPNFAVGQRSRYLNNSFCILKIYTRDATYWKDRRVKLYVLALHRAHWINSLFLAAPICWFNLLVLCPSSITIFFQRLLLIIVMPSMKQNYWFSFWNHGGFLQDFNKKNL